MSEKTDERRIIFISHALPEDVEVALWVSAKLRNEGYDVWCEVEQIHGGEHFWKKIEPIIREKTVKFILLASHTSVKKSGVRDEWDFARTVAQEYNLQDFIIPINLDGVSPNSIIGLSGLAMIQFQNSWAYGLRALLKKLHRDGVYKSIVSTPLSSAHWYFNNQISYSAPIKKTEKFYSNWVEIPRLPKYLYFYGYTNNAQAKAVLREIRDARLCPMVRHDTYLVTFEPSIPLTQLSQEHSELYGVIEVKPLHSLKVETRLICTHRYNSETFPNKQDASNLLVQLLQQVIHEFLIERGLRTYELSSQRLCYFYPRQDNADKKAQYKYEGKVRSKQLSGHYYESFWHFGISFNPRIKPILSLSLKSHIIFSDDGQTIWNDKKKLFSARRKKGKRMYNAEWRDSLLSFLGSLADNQTTFLVSVSANQQLEFSATPVTFTSPVGYNDPVDQGRLAPLDDYEEEDESVDNPEFDVESALTNLLENNSLDKSDEDE